MSSISPDDLDGVLQALRDAADRAASIALASFRPGARTIARIDYKEGGSPVSAADLAVDRFLKDHLGALFPEAGWLSEETADTQDRLERRHVLVVDPIDGTRGYVSGDARWAVSIGLVTDGRPTVGVVYAPALQQKFEAVRGGGARLNGAPIAVSGRNSLAGARIAGPADFGRKLGAAAAFRIVPKIPSLACRFVDTAAGFVDGCVAARNSHDWDLAAADLILHEAGGVLTDRNSTALTYNRPHPSHPTLVGGSPLMHRALLDVLRGASV